jgi:peptidyl-prolyl cis-trans isomerase A (cyclophilin A)
VQWYVEAPAVVAGRTPFNTRHAWPRFRGRRGRGNFARMRATHLLATALVTALATAPNASCGGRGCGGSPPAPVTPAGHVLLDPTSPELQTPAPDSFDVRLETTQGEVVLRIIREWGPLGAARVYHLARHGFYDGAAFFRVLPGFAVQFGVSGRPELDAVWNEQTLPDEPRRMTNAAGTVAFAKAGPDSRTTQLFINYRLNEALDAQDFVPVGRVIAGMDVLYRLYSDYGDFPPGGRGPAFGCMLTHGNAYLSSRFPELDRIERATVIEPEG